MDLQQIETILAEYRTALLAEATARQLVIEAKARHESIEATTLLGAVASSEIDGKNKETRDRQEVVVLAHDAAVQESAALVADLEKSAALVKIAVDVIMAKVGLYKAWLYSQAPRD